MKYRVLLLRLVCFVLLHEAITVNAQEENIKGYYLDSWKHKPEQRDSVNFIFYPNGVAMLTEEETYVMVDYYKDEKKTVPDVSIVQDKYPWHHDNGNKYGVDWDSIKYVYLHDKGGNYGAIILRRSAFRQSGGCNLYENRLSGVWRQVGISYFQKDKHGSTIRSTTYSDNFGRRDTLVNRNVYQYDKSGRVLQEENYEGDSLQRMYRYSYGTEYKKTELYYGNRSMRERKEEFFKDGKLMKEVIEYFYRSNPYTHTNVYKYDAQGRKQQMLTYLDSEQWKYDHIRTRTYYYY